MALAALGFVLGIILLQRRARTRRERKEAGRRAPKGYFASDTYQSPTPAQPAGAVDSGNAFATGMPDPVPGALTGRLAGKVDDLIRLFNESSVMAESERRRRYREFVHAAGERALAEGLSHGQASGAPSHLHLDEVDFREFMKRADQNLEWQCDTVHTAFHRFQKTGEIPAPHYPMRIAVLLRKAKQHERERRFLDAWCRHFPTGNGAKYAALVERARKVSGGRASESSRSGPG